MNDDEKELLKVGAEAAMKPFASLMDKLFGGALEEIGLAWKNSLAGRRAIRQIKIFQKVQTAIDKAGFDPRTISDNVWIPAVQGALLQDDESIQEQWANLLANACDPREKVWVLPSFPAILNELTGRDAKFLSNFYDRAQAAQAEGNAQNPWQSDAELEDLYPRGGLEMEPLDLGPDALPDDEPGSLYVTLNTLERNGLIEKTYLSSNYPDSPPTDSLSPLIHSYQITNLGLLFVRACRAPRES